MYPRTVENGAGERLTFVEVVRDADGIDRLNVAMIVRPGAGPPMHVHHLQEEAMVVGSGKVGYQRPGEEPQFAGPGDTVVFPAGTPHKWWNAGATDVLGTGWAKPPLNMEYFLAELFDSMRRNGGRPSLFDIAFLATRYRSEFAMVEIPQGVQRLLFPLLLVVGRLTGRYSRYKDAPPPV